MARTTYTEISHRLVDVTAKPEAQYSMSDILSYSDFNEIKDDDFTPDYMVSNERNYNILDGSLLLLPDNPTVLDWGVWTDSKTDLNGDFENNPALTSTFDSTHTSSGITFTFAGDAYPKQVQIEWYRGTALLENELFTVTSMTHFADLTVENYNKVIMTFIGTSLPRRHVKIAEIDYGEVKVWSKGNILSANILEEVNLTSSEISINTLDFSIHDEDEEFNMLNPEGVYVALQQKQKLTVKEYINGVPTHMGKFYLDTWTNTSATIADFEAVDAIGVFDSITYKTSPMWFNAIASDVFTHIFAVAGWTDYTIETDISEELVSGYIPICSVRVALQYLCLSLRCSCVPNRNGTVEIKRLPSIAKVNLIEKSQKFGTPKISQISLVNSVAVTGYNFTVSTSSTQLYSGDLEAGTHEISFSQPATNLLISGATITESGINYAEISVPTTGTVTLIGYQYTSQSTIYTYEDPTVSASNRAQKMVDSVYLISSSNALAVAQFLYADYQRRITQKFSMTVEDEIVGDNVDVDTMLGARKTGTITSLDIDLTGGFIADVEVRG